jgi:hypothetical protein
MEMRAPTGGLFVKGAAEEPLFVITLKADCVGLYV